MLTVVSWPDATDDRYQERSSELCDGVGRRVGREFMCSAVAYFLARTGWAGDIVLVGPGSDHARSVTANGAGDEYKRPNRAERRIVF